MVYGRVYKAEFPNGKLYVGATTTSIRSRLVKHIKRALTDKNDCPAFYNAIRKYGEPTFSELCTTSSLAELNEAEKRHIDELGTSVPKGYNIREGGRNGGFGPATREKMSESHKGKVLSEETKRKISDAQKGPLHPKYGKKWDKKHMEIFRKRSLGNSNPMFGKKHREESKAKMSAAKKRFSTEEMMKIKETYAVGNITMAEIATSYEVSLTSIWRVVNGKRRCYANKGVEQNA